jgi:hypothetical protein
MSIENEIKDAFERHAGDARPDPGAWQGVRGRVVRSHRRRAAGAALATAFAVAAAAVFVPKLTHDRGIAPETPNGWTTIRSDVGGYKLSYPPSWTASEASGAADLAPPGRPSGPEGKIWFSVRAGVEPTRYDAASPEPRGVKTSGVIKGHHFVRYEYSAAAPKDYDAHSVTYRIEWQGPKPECPGTPCAGPDYTLVLSAVAQTADLWAANGPTFEKMVRSVQAIPSTAPPVQKQPTPIAKIPVSATAITATSSAFWALSASPGDGKPATLSKIDPVTNRVTGTIDVGLAPTGLASSADAVWVANGNACGIAYSCGQGGETPQSAPAPSFPQEYSVWRVDAATMKVTAKIRVGDPSGIAYGSGAVWVASGSQTATSIVRIDPATNAVTGSVTIQGIPPVSLSVGEGSVWALAGASGDHPDQAVVSSIDPATNRVTTGARLGLGSTGGDIAAGLGAAWATTVGTNSASGLARIDPATGRQVASITLPDASPVGLLAVTTGEGYVWATSARGYLWKVDPATNRPTGAPVLIGDAPPVPGNDVVTAFGSVWVAVGDGKIWRMAP